MKIFLTGGTGFIGSTLIRELIRENHEVTLLVRAIGRKKTLPERVFTVEGDPTEQGAWQEKVANHDVVINLAGASIFRRWNKKGKKEIHDSRVLTTKNIVEALSKQKGKEIYFFSASGVSYYGFHGNEVLEENSLPGKDFLAQLASKWESLARKAEEYSCRVILCRFGIVLGGNGGALGKMIPIFKLYLGGSLGKGEQWFSWIHERDLINIFLFLLKNTDIKGPVNFTAPNPVKNKEMAIILREVLKKRSLIPYVPSAVLKFFLGELANVFLKGQRVIPQKLLEKGFTFQFPTLKEALWDLIGEG